MSTDNAERSASRVNHVDMRQPKHGAIEVDCFILSAVILVEKSQPWLVQSCITSGRRETHIIEKGGQRDTETDGEKHKCENIML